MSQLVAAFRGAVRAERPASGPVGLTLGGAQQAGEPLEVLFSGARAAPLPELLADVSVAHDTGSRYQVSGTAAGNGVRAWPLEAHAVHVHTDVGAAFCQALPPRAVPLKRRLMWTLILRLAASRVGLKLLAALRR